MISLLLTGAFPVYALPVETVPASWENISPLPSGNKANGVTIGAGTVVVVGEGGSIGTLSNSTTWAIRNSGVADDLNDIINAGTGVNAKFVAVGDNGTVITSTNGTSWTPQTTGINDDLNAIVYGGGRLVAVGDSGKVITSSDDGVTWFAPASGVNVDLNAVVYGDSKFVAVGDNGTILHFSEGSAWAKQESGSDKDLNGISYGGNVFVAAGAEGEILSAPNALGTWTKGTSGVTSNLNSVSFNSNRFFIAGDSGKLLYSGDGTTGWNGSVSVAGTTDNLLKIKATDAGYYIIGSEGAIFFATKSTNGVSNWEKFSSPTPSALKTITFANSTYITAGTDGLIGTSTDGRVWTKVVSGTTGDINSIAYGSGKFVTVGANGQTLTSSNNGTSWSAGTSVDSTTLNGIVYGGNLFVAVGNSGKIVTSADGVNWTKVTDSKTVSHLNAVAYGNNKYVAVGSDGTVVSSLNGTEWKAEVSKADSKLLNDISYGSDKFMAVGVSGKVLASPDSTKGAAYTADPQVNLNGVASGNSLFMAAGDNGYVYYSNDAGQNWHLDTSGTTKTLNAIGYFAGLNRFIAVGDSGTMIMSKPVVNTPQVIGLSPEHSETNVEIDADLTLTFNQKVKAANGKIYIHSISDATPAETVLVEEIPANDSRVTVVNNEVTVNPEKDLVNGTEYEVTVEANAFYDESQSTGNQAIESGSWRFKTVAAVDTAAPIAETYSPENGATGVARDAVLTLTFDEKVTADNGFIKIFKSANGVTEEVDTILATTEEKVSVSGKTVTITPYNLFEYDATYYVNIDSGAFRDEAGNGYAGISDSTTWSFKTIEEPDTTPPAVSTLSPANGATGVATGTNLVVTFSEDVQKATGNIELYNSTNVTAQPVVIPVTSQNVNIEGNVVTINPDDNLDFGSGYYVHIADNAFKDTAGNAYAGITNNTTWKFTTIGAPPTVSLYSPVSGATGVAKDANLVLTFSENVTKADGNIKIFNSADSVNPVMTISVNTPFVAVKDNVVTVDLPNDLAYSSTYFVQIESGAFKGAGGSYFAGISDSTTWKFTTVAAPDTTAPTVSAFSPENGSADVAVETNLTLTFSENVVAGEGNIVIYNSANNTPVATISAQDAVILDNVVTINPANDLGYAASYYVRVGSGAFKDTAGNSYAGITNNTAWQFTTTAVPDRTSPTVSTYAPESWATEVATSANLALTFSENVVKSDGRIEIFKSTDEMNPVVTIPANSGNVTIQNNVVTINPVNDLEYGTSYFVRITEGAFKDLAGNSFAGITGITAWRFMTTSLPDTAAPLVTAFSPADNAVNVPVSTALTLSFNENVTAGDAEIVIMNAATDSAVTAIKANNTALVSITNATVTIKTSGLLVQGGSYYVVVQPDAFKDEAGNSFAGFADKAVWNFSTVPVPVTPDPEPANPGPSTPAAPAPSVPSSSTETISANVENGAAQGSTVSSVAITRTKDASGVKKDELTFTPEQVLRAINELKAAGSNTARIFVPDANDEVAETKVTIPAASGKQIADNQINLDLFTVNAEVKVPGSSLINFVSDVYFHLVPLKSQQQISDAEARARTEIQNLARGELVTLVSRPIKIDTNLQNRPVTLVLPINSASLTPAELQQLAVYIEHSDGTKELAKGEIVPYGQTGKSGIQFNVNKFSTFTVVLAQAPAVEVKAYMTGYADGTFKPGQSITRAEIASIIARTFNQSAAISGAAYTDIAAGHWAANAINQVSASGIMKGYEDGSFKPNQTITRAEMATILSRLITGAQGNGVNFSDIAGHWAQAAVKVTAEAGIITGYEDGTFRPNQSLTRAETVTIINRALGIAPLTSAAQKWTDVPAQYWAYGSIQAASVDHTAE
ncbi:Ig-like domain-containing protein [Paenibacillus sp. FSL R7-0345]|uniref:Ig-like domain-containing protein n=1 Tax=Paenibacillus sp. FSL R7-0345 TaxID=2954535 RepID=UPI00315A4136